MSRLRFVAALCALLSSALCSAAVAQPIVVGAKEFTEQLLVAEMTKQLLQAEGLSIHRGSGFTSSGLRKLQEDGIIDICWEYTGTSLTAYNHVTEKLSPAEGYRRVKALDAKGGLVWLAPSRVNNTYALAMRRAAAAARSVGAISDLATTVRRGEAITLAATVEFVERPDGLKPLERAYGFAFGLGNVVGMPVQAIYDALGRASEFDVGVVFATDGRIAALDLAVLRDDLGFFPPYLLAPVVRQATLDRHPTIGPALERLSAQLDNESMAALNAAVDLQGRRVEDAAADFLRSRGLLARR